MGATAAWVYQKWAANVLESVFRVFGGDLEPIFRKNHQISRSHDVQPKGFTLVFLGGWEFAPTLLSFKISGWDPPTLGGWERMKSKYQIKSGKSRNSILYLPNHCVG